MYLRLTITMNVVKINTSKQLTTHITSSTRKGVIKFTRNTCKPCKLFTQKIKDTDLPIDLYDVDFSENKHLARLFNVTVLPTAVFIDENQPVARMNGLKDYDDFIELVEDVSTKGCVVVHWS